MSSHKKEASNRWSTGLSLDNDETKISRKKTQRNANIKQKLHVQSNIFYKTQSNATCFVYYITFMVSYNSKAITLTFYKKGRRYKIY
jgi:hypothetical protein